MSQTSEINEIIYKSGEAILKLLDDKSFEAISITDICKLTHISRSTYYRNLNSVNSKLDALKYYINKSWQIQYNSISIQGKSMEEVLLNYIYMNKDNIVNLADNNLSYVVDNFLLDVFKRFKTDDQEYYITYVRSGIWIGIVHALIDSNFEDAQETVATQLIASVLASAQ